MERQSSECSVSGTSFDAIDDESLLIANLIDPVDELLPVSDADTSDLEEENDEEEERVSLNANLDGFRPDSI